MRGVLPKLTRAVLCALITIDVHARDMVSGMVKREVGDRNVVTFLIKTSQHKIVAV